MPSQFTVSNSPVTSSGTLTASWNNQNKNMVFAGPATGSASLPTFRALVASDLPSTDSIWSLNTADTSVFLSNNNNKVGIGTNDPVGKFVVKGDEINNSSDLVPLFTVKDKDGNDVFVVYPKGVMVYIDEVPLGTNETTQVSGFRVGKPTGTGSKGFEDEYFTISPKSETDTLASQARILWYPLKEAFMSGRIIVESVDSVGLNSWASGFESKSIGNYSQALGYKARAKGNNSTAIGNYAYALGDNSFAFGDSTIAGGGGGLKALNNFCYAFGKGSKALGNGSYAFGYGANSTGSDAFAFGTGTEASGMGSFAIGFIGRDSANISTGNTKATADWAVAIGMGSQSTYKGAFSIGTKSLAQNEYALAMGYKTLASGMFSSAFGKQTSSIGTGSTAMGFSTTASGNYSTAMGQYTIASGKYSTAIGWYSEASGDHSVAMGQETEAIGEASTSMGAGTKASGDASTAMGAATIASNSSSTAMGNGTRASGFVSTAIGYQTLASGQQSTAMGAYTTASEYATTAMGQGTTASGIMSTAMGNESTASGSYSTTLGYYTAATGNYSTALGNHTTAQAHSSFVIGRYNLVSGTTDTWVDNEALFVIGKGSSSSDRSNAMLVLKNGKVSIGATTPNCRLHVNATETDEDGFRVQIAGSTKLYVDNNGGTAIGSLTVPPINGLFVKGNIRMNDSSIFLRDDNNHGLRYKSTVDGPQLFGWDGGQLTTIHNNRTSLQWDYNGYVYLPYTYSATVGATNRDLYIDNTGKLGYVSSSVRYKKSITNMENVNWIYSLRPVNYCYKNDSSERKQYGLIAEEVEKTNPLFVSYNEDGTVETVQYSQLITPMLKAIQELKKEIEMLRSENSELKKQSAQIEELTKKYDELIKMMSISAEKK
jgi:hypothetical protein